MSVPQPNATPAADVAEDIARWRDEAVRNSGFSCTPIPFAASREWRFEGGILRHRTGGFFAVGGLKVAARSTQLDGQEQPMLLQPEPAISGLLLRRRGAGCELLFQGRVEPGNVGGMQLAPTVQATVSNYRRVHGGAATRYIEWFTGAHAGRVLVDDLQSEEGTRYYGKYNRNAVVELPPGFDEPPAPGFRWLGMDAVRRLAAANYMVNSDARSALASVAWRELAGEDGPFAGHAPGSFGAALRRSHAEAGADGVVDTLRWLAGLRAACAARHRVVPLDDLRDWTVGASAISERRPAAGFAIRQFAVVASGREVAAWDQPLVDSAAAGRLALVCQRRQDVLHFLISAACEIGLLEGVQLSTSVVWVPGQGGLAGSPELALTDLIDEGRGVTVHLDFEQSEEGGRFYQDRNRYQLVELDPAVVLPPHDRWRWLTLGQLAALVTLPGALTIELRCALTSLLPWL